MGTVKRLFYIACCVLIALPCFALEIRPGLVGFGTETRGPYEATGAAGSPWICIVDSLLTTTGSPSWDSSNYTVGVFKGTFNQCLEGLDTEAGGTLIHNAMVTLNGTDIGEIFTDNNNFYNL